MKLELFKINPKTRVADLDKAWIGTIKEFKELLVRDKGSVGDADGRKKLQATKEFTFIYHYCDYGSKFINYSEKDKLAACLSNAGLPPDTKIEKDKALLDAIEVYKALQTTPAIKMLNEVREGIHTGIAVIRTIRIRLEAVLEASNTLEEFDIAEESPKDKKKTPPEIDKIASMLQKIMDLGNLLPKTLETIDKLDKQIKKDMSDEVVLRGGNQKGVREDAITPNDVPSKLMSTN